MSNSYPEEAAILPASKDGDPHNTDDVVAHGKRLIQQKWTELLEEAKKAVNWGGSGINGRSPLELAQMELSDNAAGVEELRKQYARHDARFNDVSNEEFLTRIVMSDKDNIHTLADVDKAIAARLKTSREREVVVMSERVAAVDGENMDSKVRNPWGLGHYKKAELLALEDDKHKELIDAFKKDYKAEIDLAASKLGTEEAGYRATLAAVKKVHDQEWAPGGSVSRGDDFHKKVRAEIESSARAIISSKAAAEQKELTDAGINLNDAAQRAAISHAVSVMGHDDTNVPADQLQNSPHAKRVLQQFKQDFDAEIKASGGKVDKVVAAVNAVYAASNGENGGQRKLNAAQFKSAVDAQMYLNDSGIDLGDLNQRKALSLATYVSSPQAGKLEELLIKNAKYDDQVKLVQKFQSDYAKEIQMAGGDAAKVLEAISKVDLAPIAATSRTDMAQAKADFHTAIAAQLGDETARASLKKRDEPEQRSAPAPQERSDNGQIAPETLRFMDLASKKDMAEAAAALAKLKEDREAGNAPAAEKDLHAVLVAMGMVAHEKELLTQHPGYTKDQAKADLEQYRQTEMSMTNAQLQLLVNNAPGTQQSKRERQ